MHMYSTCREVEGYKADLLLRAEKRYLWLAAVDRKNCLSIIHMYTQRSLLTKILKKNIVSCTHRVENHSRPSNVRLQLDNS